MSVSVDFALGSLLDPNRRNLTRPRGWRSASADEQFSGLPVRSCKHVTADNQITRDTVSDLRIDKMPNRFNGALVPTEEAKVSVYDSGSMLGDGTWGGVVVQ